MNQKAGGQARGGVEEKLLGVRVTRQSGSPPSLPLYLLPCPLTTPLLPPSLSILGMHLFGCKFSLKTDTGDTVPDRKNFDSLLWAIVTVFQVKPGQGPSPDVNRCGPREPQPALSCEQR